MTVSPRVTIRARWVFPVEGEPIPEGVVTYDRERGRLLRVGPYRGEILNRDLGNAAIVPGFVNAHTHLELNRLQGEPLEMPDPDRDATGSTVAVVPENEVAWLKRVVGQRIGVGLEELARRAAENLQKALRAGTTLLADITTAGASWPAISAAPVGGVVFSEVLGLKRQRGLETNERAWDWLRTVTPQQQVISRCRVGLSPHAPYSTAGWLYQRAAGCGLPLTTHLAEMPEERMLLESGQGPLREFLEELGAWDDEWEPIGPRPTDYIRRDELKQTDWLVAHGNDLRPDELWQFRPDAAPPGKRVALVYCPRTHARFGHPPHPFLELLHQGAIVCLGTDSLASAPTLSVLDEARFLRRRDPRLSGRLLLTMSTLFGAWALRAETITGSLRPGKSADLAVVSLPERDADDPHDLLFDSDRPVLATMFAGRWLDEPDAADSSV